MKTPLISSDPDIMMGKPVITGTRITVERILEKLAYGETIEQILQDYPNLTVAQIQAGIEFALENLRNSYNKVA